MDLFECIVLFLVASLVTLALIPAVKRFAHRVDAIDYPSGRRINTTPIPRLGGVAMFGGMFAAGALMVICVKLHIWDPALISHPSLHVDYTVAGLGVTVMFLVGLLDDIFDLKPKVKFAGQLIAASIVAYSGVLLASIHNPVGLGYIEFGWLAYPITVIYLVAFANIINLIDGLDGLATGITIITMATILVFATLTGRTDAVVLAIIVIGACLGFLHYNHHPATIFMGDSGSLLLGLMLGVVSLFAIARSALFVSLLVPILAAGVPIVDTLMAIVRRKMEHRPIDQADKGHIHHRLLAAGFSQSATVGIMWGWTAFLSLGAVVITLLHGWVRIIVALLLIVVSTAFIRRLHLLEPALLHRYSPRMSRRKRRELARELGALSKVKKNSNNGENVRVHEDGEGARREGEFAPIEGEFASANGEHTYREENGTQESADAASHDRGGDKRTS